MECYLKSIERVLRGMLRERRDKADNGAGLRGRVLVRPDHGGQRRNGPNRLADVCQRTRSPYCDAG